MHDILEKMFSSNEIKLRSSLALAIILCVFLPIGISAKNMWAAGNPPKETVQRFCTLDAEGKRLSSETWKSITPLITWREEPGWDMTTVISKFEIVGTKIEGDKARIVVKYHVLGSTNAIDFKSLKTDEITEFELVNDKDNWKINGPVITPHVNKRTILDHLRQIEKSEPTRREKLEALIKRLERSK